MNSETEQKIEHKEEKHEEKSKEIKINLTRFGKNSREVLENISFLIIVISAIMFSVGIGLGSFISGTIFLSVFGSFFILIGIVIYIISQFLGVSNG